MDRIVKIVVFVPLANADELRGAMGNAGAGRLGDYTHCSFSTRGIGRFIPGSEASPHIGTQGKPEEVEEERIEMVCARSIARTVVEVIKEVHPYEEIPIEIYELVDLDEHAPDDR